MTPEEKRHEIAVTKFFQQAIEDGQIPESQVSLRQIENLTLTEEIRSVGPRGSLKTFDDFIEVAYREIGWPESDVRRCIELHLETKRLTKRHIELFINYPEWTERELARAYQIPRTKVQRMLAKVRKSWHGLRLDMPIKQRDECPELRHMKRIEVSAISDDRLNTDEVIKF